MIESRNFSPIASIEYSLFFDKRIHCRLEASIFYGIWQKIWVSIVMHVNSVNLVMIDHNLYRRTGNENMALKIA